MDSTLVVAISWQEDQQIIGIKESRSRFEVMLGLLQSKMELLTRRDHPLDYILLTLPHDLYLKCRVTEYSEKTTDLIHRDLRRAFKAMAMEFRKPTRLPIDSTAT